jgi:hypothetical protein
MIANQKELLPSPFDEGYRAGCKQLSIICPYPDNSLESDEWNQGYEEGSMRHA